MQHGLLLPNGCTEPHPDRHGCPKPCCGYILEEIHSHQQECCCFHGILDICGLPARLVAPLSLCSVEVVCITPQGVQNRTAFCLTLRCEVADCCGCRACGEACMTVTLRHAPGRCGENLRLGARIDVREARFCAPSSFQVCADVCLVVVKSGAGRIIRQQPCAPACLFPPLYPAPLCGLKGKTRIISGLDS